MSQPTPAPPRPGRSRQVLAVVPTLDVGSQRLERLLTSIDDLATDEPMRTIVIANRGAEPQTRSVPPPDRRPRHGVEVVESGLNLGFAGSIAFGATLSEFSYLWLLQDDLVVEPGCLAELLTALDRDPSLGAVNPTRIDDEGLVHRGHSGGLLDPDGRITALLPRTSVHLRDYVPDEQPDFLMSRGMLVRAEAWHGVGGIDARFFPVGWSDVDLCVRLRRAGWGLATVRTAAVLHEKGASTPRALEAVTTDRNGALFRAALNGAGARPPVHPDVPREVLEAVAQAAGTLTLDLARALDVERAQRVAPRPRPRTVAGRLREAVGRTVRAVLRRIRVGRHRSRRSQ